MTLMQRIGKVLSALLSVLCALLVLALKEEGFELVILVLSWSLILLGVRDLYFYFTMARHMVDGRGVLWFGVIVLDFGIFTLSMSQNQGLFIVIYLLGLHAFSGVIGIVRALESRSYHAPSWRLNLISGIMNIVFAGAAVYFGLIRSDMQSLCWIYALGLFYSAATKLLTAFHKTAIVYIQ